MNCFNQYTPSWQLQVPCFKVPCFNKSFYLKIYFSIILNYISKNLLLNKKSKLISCFMIVQSELYLCESTLYLFYLSLLFIKKVLYDGKKIFSLCVTQENFHENEKNFSDIQKIFPYWQGKICAYIFQIIWKCKRNFHKTFLGISKSQRVFFI